MPFSPSGRFELPVMAGLAVATLIVAATLWMRRKRLAGLLALLGGWLASAGPLSDWIIRQAYAPFPGNQMFIERDEMMAIFRLGEVALGSLLLLVAALAAARKTSRT